MGERYHGHGSCAVGAAKGILNLHVVDATPTHRARIYEVIVGCVAAPADAATKFAIIRTTAFGTEGAGFTPVKLDPASPDPTYDFGVGVFGAEPTKTASKELLLFSMNQRATFRWVAAPGAELVLPATQNNGACLQSVSSTVATAHEGAIYYEE